MKRFVHIVALLLVTCLAQAQLLWEVSGNGLPYKSYLFGTHHLVSVSFLDSVHGVYKAFNSCRMVVGEVAVNDPSMIQKMTEAAQMPHYTNMHKLFNDSDYAYVDSCLKKVLKMGLAELALMKPAMISNMYTLTLYQQLFPNADDDWQVDSFFQQVAEQKNVPIVGLESVDDQIALLYNAQTLERQAYLLLGTVKESDSMYENMLELNQLYKSGDLDGLLGSFRDDNTEYAYTETERYAMLDDRNAMWMQKLPKLMLEKPCFVAVGALHLAGENGLIALLRQAGYKVKAVKR